MLVGQPLLALGLALYVLPRRLPSGPELAAFLVMYAVSNLGIGVGYHRLFTHKSFRAGRGVRAALAVAGSLAGQGPVIYWSALHRMHHANAERDGDPHSPHAGAAGPVRGFLHA